MLYCELWRRVIWYQTARRHIPEWSQPRESQFKHIFFVLYLPVFFYQLSSCLSLLSFHYSIPSYLIHFPLFLSLLCRLFHIIYLVIFPRQDKRIYRASKLLYLFRAWTNIRLNGSCITHPPAVHLCSLSGCFLRITLSRQGISTRYSKQRVSTCLQGDSKSS